MSADFIKNVSEADFEFEVVTYSQNVPVVVDFWAAWCRPCKTLSPLLEHLALESQGSFRLAKVDVDANPNLAILYGVRSLPTIKSFTNGLVAAELVGLQPEDRLREFIANIAPPSPYMLALEKADGLLNLRQWKAAEKLYRALLETNPGNPAGLLGLARVLLQQGRPAEAHAILVDFPTSRQFPQAELLRPYAQALLDMEHNQLAAETPLDTAFATALRLGSRGNLPAALDGLFDILRQNKRFRAGRAHHVALSLLELISDDDPDKRAYRSELASVLF